jgi:hypothetical protein
VGLGIHWSANDTTIHNTQPELPQGVRVCWHG